jgi:hypothetical protein
LDYTLADLARVTGAKRRSLQLWADAGVIVPEKSTDRGGSGTHRRFSRKEAVIACIVHAFALHQIAIGELQLISTAMRGFFLVTKGGGEEHFGKSSMKLHKTKEGRSKGTKMESEALELLESAIRGEGDATFVFESWIEEGSRQPKDHRHRAFGMAIFPTREVQLENLHEPEGFAVAILLRNYLSKIDS